MEGKVGLSRLTAKYIKEGCVVAMDYEEESGGDEDGKYELPDGQVISIGPIKHKAPEALFDPSLTGRGDLDGIHTLCFKSIMKCDVDIRDDFYSNIVLCGGSSKFKGLSERMSKELRSLAGEKGKFVKIMDAGSCKDDLAW